MLKRKPLTLATAAILSVSLMQPALADEMTDHESSADRSAGELIDDAAIATKLEAELVADPLTAATDIDIEVDRDQVQLNGFVASEEARDRAEEIAENINGVTSVANNLEVDRADRSAGQYIDDKTLTAKVKAALAGEDFPKSAVIDVEVNRGIVSLGGHLDSDGEIDSAIDTAEDVEGVRDVINNLEVRESS